LERLYKAEHECFSKNEDEDEDEDEDEEQERLPPPLFLHTSSHDSAA
jgi:hypothetical protein